MVGSLSKLGPTMGLDADEEEGYYSSEDKSEVAEGTVRRGVGESGGVTARLPLDSHYNTYVPGSLLGSYWQHHMSLYA